MSDVLYERVMPGGAVVRIRRLTPAGEVPVRAAIELDRRNSGPRRAGAGTSPPPLMAVESDSDQGVVAALLPFAEDDAAIARLIAGRGAR